MIVNPLLQLEQLNFKVDDNIVAVLKEIVVEGETFQQGIYVWSFNTQK